LYTEEDARRALKLFKPLEFDELLTLGPLQLRLRGAGHILGASSVELRQGNHSLLMSGDLGRPDDLMMKPPVPIEHGDTLVIESTYGDRTHDDGDHTGELADVIRRTAARGGMVIVPAFAVGRTQALLHQIWLLKKAKQIPDLPVFLDSPMAIDTTGIYQHHANEHRLSADDCRHMGTVARFCRTPDQSRELNQLTYPAIIISASGMATGGRILHHLKNHLGDHRCSVVFAGFQAGGTRGARLVQGERSIRIFGQDVAVNAEIVSLPGMSAHADAGQIIDWLKTAKRPPQHVYITHGEQDASDALRRRIQRELGWHASVPMMGDAIELPMG
jgi:metallo-beta-lactamase family protein